MSTKTDTDPTWNLARCEAELRVSQAREAELREELKVVTNLHAIEQDMRIAEEKLRRAAEARFKASQEQDYAARVNRQGFIIERDTLMLAEGTLLFTKPPIPPELAELQRENAELSRKLAEQQAIMRIANIAFANTAEEYRAGYLSGGSVETSNLRVEAWRAVAHCDDAELRKMLEESNVDAVRYRFLRRAWAEPAVLSALNEANPEPASDAEFDASVDAAMLAVQPKEQKQ